MSTDRDFDRISRAWLDLMPSEAPERAIDAVLQAVETTPQAGRPIVAALRRSFHMNRFSVAAVAIVAIAVIGGGVLVSRLSLPATGGPSPSIAQSPPPSSSPSPATGSPLPASLQGAWLGGHRDLPGLENSAGLALHITAEGIGISPPNTQNVRLLSAVGSAAADGRISLETSRSDSVCKSGDTGSYSWTLSASGQTLTLTAVAETCAARATALAGAWWLDDCKRAPCFGTLDAGTYGAEYFDPRVGSRTWSPRFGALTFTVPDGWAASQDNPNIFILTPASNYATEAEGGPGPGAYREVDFYSAPRQQASGVNCDGTPDEKAGHSAADLSAFLRRNRALTVDELPSTTVGGSPATVLDVRLASSWTHQCPGDGVATTYLAGTLGSGSQTSAYSVAIARGERQRVLLVDIGQGDVVTIVIDSSNPDQFNSLLDAATPIIESIQFK